MMTTTEIGTTPNRTAQIISTVAFLLAILAAIFFRLYWLEIKPLHHDEGVNSHFLLNLASSGEYKYDPNNYHGPSLYYFVLIALKIFGESEFALRIFPAICGILTVALLWGLRRGLGLIGLPAAAWSLALCPGVVYYSRDFIHESSFGLFTVAIIVCVYNWEKKYSLILFSIFTGLLFTTKETSIHTVFVLSFSVLCAAIWWRIRQWIRGEEIDWPRFDRNRFIESTMKTLAVFLPIFTVIYITLYTSFFTNPKGPLDFWRSVFKWTGRGYNEHIHDHVFGYYFGILLKLELPLVIFAVIGIVLTLWRGSRFGLFLMSWTCGMVLGYSMIPYKTPWLMVSMLIALAVFSGYVAQEIHSVLRFTAPQIAFIALLIALAVPIWRTSWQVNMVKYEDNENTTGYLKKWGEKLKLRAYSDTQYGYVYAQTNNDMRNMVSAIERYKPATITYATSDYWPLPWYLRKFQIAGYDTSVPDNFDGAMLITRTDQEAEALEKLQNRYNSEEFVLRPGVNLLVYTKK